MRFDGYPFISFLNSYLHVCFTAFNRMKDKASSYSGLVAFQNDFLFFDDVLASGEFRT